MTCCTYDYFPILSMHAGISMIVSLVQSLQPFAHRRYKLNKRFELHRIVFSDIILTMFSVALVGEDVGMEQVN